MDRSSILRASTKKRKRRIALQRDGSPFCFREWWALCALLLIWDYVVFAGSAGLFTWLFERIVSLMVQSRKETGSFFLDERPNVTKSHGKHAKDKASSKDNKVTDKAQDSRDKVDSSSPKAASPREKAASREAGQLFVSDAYDPDRALGVQAVAQPAELEKKRNAKKIVGIVCACIFGALAVVYLAGVVVFSNWYYPGTVIGSIDASMKSTGDVESELLSAVKGYRVRVTGDGFDCELDMTEMGVSVDADTIAEKMHAALPAWQWPLLISQQNHQLTDLFVADYSGSSKLNDAIREKVDQFNETATQPQDAAVQYDAQEKRFVVVAEKHGTALDADAVVKEVDTSIVSFQSVVVLGNDQLAQPKIASSDTRLENAAETATSMSSITLNLSMAGHSAGVIDSDLISQWIKIDDEYAVTLDTDAVNAYITQLEGDLDTVGSQRTYTRPDGKQVSVSGGVYGWEVDGDALRSTINDAVASATSQDIDIPCLSTGAEYNGAGKKDWGNRYVDIDLAEQHVRMYDDSGALVWESDCISGTPDGEHDTSVGVYWVNAKKSPSKLIGYENGKKIYESTVQYWMPFDGNAIGLHDADWQPGFGGTMYREGYGSHGCVNLPPDAAAKLYQILQEGDCVVSHW